MPALSLDEIYGPAEPKKLSLDEIYGAVSQPKKMVEKPNPSIPEYVYKRTKQGALDTLGSYTGFAEGIARATGKNDAAESIKGFRENTLKPKSEQINREIGEQQSALMGPDSIVNKFKEDRLTAGDVARGLADPVLSNISQMVPSALGSKIASKVARGYGFTSKGAQLAAEMTGSTAFMAAQETGSIYNDQKDGEKDLLKAAVTGVPAGILEAAGQLYTLKKAGLSGLVGEAEKKAGKVTLGSLTKGGLSVMAEEAATEGAQNILEQAGAKPGGLKAIPTDLLKTDWEEVAENAIGGAIAGGGMHTAGAPVQIARQYNQDREERLLQLEIQSRSESLAASSVVDAKEEVEATQQAEQEQARVADLQQKAALLPEIETTITNPDTPVQPEQRQILVDVAEGLSGTKEGLKAASLLSKFDKSLEKDSEESFKDLHKQLDDTKFDAKHDLLNEEHIAAIQDIFENHLDGKTRDKAKTILETYQQMQEKKQNEEQKAIEAKQKEQEKIAQEQQDHLDSIFKHKNELSTEAAKLQTAKAKVEDVISTAQKKIKELQKETAEPGMGQAKQEAIKAERLKIQSAREDLLAANYEHNIATHGDLYASAAKHIETVGNVWKNFKEFALDMIDKYGENIKKHLMSLYGHAKKVAKTADELIKKLPQPGLSLEVLDKNGNPTSQVDTLKMPPKNERMSHEMPSNQNIYGEDTSTLQLAEDGRRIASTRSFKIGNGEGSVVTFEGRPTQYKIVGYEQITPEKAADPEWVKQWSQREGWTPEHFYKVYNKSSTVKDGSWQTIWEKVGETKQQSSQQRKIASEVNNNIQEHRGNPEMFTGAPAMIRDGKTHLNMDVIENTFNNRKSPEQIEELNAKRPNIMMKFEKLGVSPQQFLSLFDTLEDYKQYLIRHEESHLRNKDSESQVGIWKEVLAKHPLTKEGREAATREFRQLPQIVDLEVRATKDDLNAEQMAKYNDIVSENIEDEEAIRDFERRQNDDGEYAAAMNEPKYYYPNDDNHVLEEDVSDRDKFTEQTFDQYASGEIKGGMQKWMRDAIDSIGAEAAVEALLKIWNDKAKAFAQEHPELKITGKDKNNPSTLTIADDSPLHAIPNFSRLMVGAHGVYIELNAVPEEAIDRGMAPAKQYHIYSYSGAQVYDQKKTVNYASYIPGKVYVSAVYAQELLEPHNKDKQNKADWMEDRERQEKFDADKSEGVEANYIKAQAAKRAKEQEDAESYVSAAEKRIAAFKKKYPGKMEQMFLSTLEQQLKAAVFALKSTSIIYTKDKIITFFTIPKSMRVSKADRAQLERDMAWLQDQKEHQEEYRKQASEQALRDAKERKYENDNEYNIEDAGYDANDMSPISDKKDESDPDHARPASRTAEEERFDNTHSGLSKIKIVFPGREMSSTKSNNDRIIAGVKKQLALNTSLTQEEKNEIITELQMLASEKVYDHGSEQLSSKPEGIVSIGSVVEFVKKRENISSFAKLATTPDMNDILNYFLENRENDNEYYAPSKAEMSARAINTMLNKKDATVVNQPKNMGPKKVVPHVTLQQRYDIFKDAKNLYQKSYDVIDAFFVAIDDIMDNQLFNSAHPMDAQEIANFIVGKKTVDGKYIDRFPELKSKYAMIERVSKEDKAKGIVPELKAKPELVSLVKEIIKHSYMNEHQKQDQHIEDYSNVALAEHTEIQNYDINPTNPGDLNVSDKAPFDVNEMPYSPTIINVSGVQDLFDVTNKKTKARMTLNKTQFKNLKATKDMSQYDVEQHSKKENATTIEAFLFKNKNGTKTAYFTKAQMLTNGEKTMSKWKRVTDADVLNRNGKNGVPLLWGNDSLDDVMGMYNRFIAKQKEFFPEDNITQEPSLGEKLYNAWQDLKLEAKEIKRDQELGIATKEQNDRLKELHAKDGQGLVDKAKMALIKEIRPARNLAMQYMFRQSHILDNNYFEEMAKGLNEEAGLEGQNSITPEKLFGLYEKNGYEFDGLLAQARAMAEEKIEDAVRTAYNELSKVSTNPEALVLANLTDGERKLYDKIFGENSVDADKQLRELSRATSAKFQTIRKLELRALSYSNVREGVIGVQEAFDRDQENQAKVSVMVGNDIKKMSKADAASRKDEKARIAKQKEVIKQLENEAAEVAVDQVLSRENYVEYSQQTDLSEFGGALKPIAKMRSSIAQTFFQKIAQLFDADLVLAEGKDFRGKYVPKANDGRSKIIINPFMSSGLTRVFAHELFHHVLNKISPEAYRAFREAMMDSVDKDVWNKVVKQKLAEKGFLSPEDRYELLKTFEFNRQPDKARTTFRMARKSRDTISKTTDFRKVTNSAADMFGFPSWMASDLKEDIITNLKADTQVPASIHQKLRGAGEVAGHNTTLPIERIVNTGTSRNQDMNTVGSKKKSWIPQFPLDKSVSLPMYIRDLSIERKNEFKSFITRLQEQGSIGKQLSKEEFEKAFRNYNDWIEFQAETKNNNAAYDEEKVAIEEEIHAEIFAQAFHQKSFWDALAKTVEGRGIGAMLLVRMAEQSAKLIRFISTLNKSEVGLDPMNNAFVSSMVKDWSGKSIISVRQKDGTYKNELHFDGGVNALLAEVVANALDGKGLRHNKEKHSTTFEPLQDPVEIKNDVAQTDDKNILSRAKSLGLYAKNKKESVVASYVKNSQGTKGYVGVMNAIEKWLDSIFNWIAKHKPAEMFADFKTREDIVAIANDLLHAGKIAREEAEHRILSKHKDVFENMTITELRALHDKVSRNVHTEEELKAALSTIPEKQRLAFIDMEKEARSIYDKLAAVKMLPPRLLSDGSVNPESRYRIGHMGQSINWRRNGIKANERIDAALDLVNKDASKLKRNERFLEEKSGKSTEEIAKEFEHKTINPLELFTDYVEDAHQLIAVKTMISEARNAGLAIQARSAFEAAMRTDGPFEAIDDNALKVMHEIPGMDDISVVDFYKVVRQKKIEKTRKGKTITIWVDDKNYEGANFETEQEATDHIMNRAERGQFKYSVKAETKNVEKHIMSDLYFHKDLAHLINVILSKDKIRSTAAGQKIMDIKNTLTMFELSLSMFHWLTIGQEVATSYAAFKTQQARMEGKSMPHLRGSASLLNLRGALKEARELKDITRKIITDNNYQNTEEGKSAILRLLGTNDVDMVDVYKQFFSHGGAFTQDSDLRSSIASWGESEKSFNENWDKLKRENPDDSVVNISKTMMHQIFVKSSSKLMEDIIPRSKFAAFAYAYTMGMQEEAKRLGRDLSSEEKKAIARNKMKFVEDKFGEVNWKNMWLDKSYKTALQFLFRSFTWVAGSWKALAKAGIDWAKLGWFTLKDKGQSEENKRNYQLTEQGLWGVNAIISHALSAGMVTLVYSMFSGDDEQPTEEDTSWITKMLFPRVDPYDNTKRITIPSYISEAYKIFMHLGLINGSKFEPEKLVTGRFNSIIGRTMDLIGNEDFRGVKIMNPDDNMVMKGISLITHVLGTGMPMSLSGMKKIYQDEGMSTTMLFNALGAQDAPAAAKRSHAANLAFDLSRREYKGKEMTEDEMDLKDDLKRAMRKYVEGDKSVVESLLREGKISQRQYDIAVTRYPVLDNAPNPKYKDQLSQALQRLTVKSALKVYDVMTDNERAKHTQEIQKKINNMRLRKDTPKEQQEKYISKWNDLRLEYAH